MGMFYGHITFDNSTNAKIDLESLSRKLRELNWGQEYSDEIFAVYKGRLGGSPATYPRAFPSMYGLGGYRHENPHDPIYRTFDSLTLQQQRDFDEFETVEIDGVRYVSVIIPMTFEQVSQFLSPVISEGWIEITASSSGKECGEFVSLSDAMRVHSDGRIDYCVLCSGDEPFLGQYVPSCTFIQLLIGEQ